MNEEIKKMFHWTKGANKILLLTNNRPNVDTVASLIGLQSLLKAQNKEVVSVIPGKIPEETAFLPGVKEIKNSIGNKNDLVISISTENIKLSNLSHVMNDGSVEIIISGDNNPFTENDISFKRSAEKFDLIITLGASKLADTGNVFLQNPKLFTQTPVINISKEIETEFFGKVNIINAHRSSLCEIVFDIVNENEELQKNLDKTLSTILISGILSETESFLANTTSANSLRTAAALQRHKADQSMVVEQLFKEKTYKNIKTLGLILNNFELSSSHKFCWSELDRKDFHQIDTDGKDIDHWSDQLLRHTNDSDFLALFVEFKDKTLIQLRTKNQPISFDSLKGLDNIIFEKHKYGADIYLSNTSIDDIKNDFLKRLSNIQEKRLHLEENSKLETINIEELPTKAPVIDLPKFPGKKGSDNIPMNIPFEAPEKK